MDQFSAGRKRGRPAGGRLADEREGFFRLLDEGVRIGKACERVGVSRHTGVAWRRERGLPVRPYVRADPALSGKQAAKMVDELVEAGGQPGRYLDLLERIHIADRHREGASVRRIAAELDRSPSTVSREVRRNGHAGDPQAPYRAERAQHRAAARKTRPKPRRIVNNPELRALVQAILDDDLSPEQISNRLRRDFPDRPELHVCTETIYSTLYVHGRGILRRELKKVLRSGRSARKPRRAADARQPRFRDPMTSIHDRPAEVAERVVPGHWEGDLILGANNRSAMATLVERTTRFTLVVPLPDGHDADTVQVALTEAIKALPVCLAKTLTWDQGAELARHLALSVATNMQVYFCDPHSPWQRGLNENTNGLLRQYFPKGTDLSVHSAEHVAAVAAKLNRRPRKVLDWDTPAERLTKLLSDHTTTTRCDDR
ncbi:IS30 family transposase [Catenulispora pinisilvae]|uniref:IS30 family transposase n=1 Tax=Catenulispora pinisilvae TaxID=2705253 RepID=UPI001892349A|nr:IS30 family transposase [Catenulispora pinisilvae]